MPNNIAFAAEKIKEQKAWDERFRDPENWTGVKGASLSDEAEADLERTIDLLGPVVETMTEPEATEVADEYARKLEDLESAFSRRLQGPKARSMLRAYFMGPVFGFNIYAEGTSGVAKTWTMNQLSRHLSIPFAMLHARSDSSDAELIGEERLVRGAKGADNQVAFAHGVVTKPGVCGVMIDEFPRLPARSSNSCLQAMEDKWVRVPLNSLQKPDHRTTLSAHFSFIACGNPASYVGQGERNRALFDRFAIGIEVVRPADADTFLMYQTRDDEVRPPKKLNDFGANTFHRVKAAAQFATFAQPLGTEAFDFKAKTFDTADQFLQLMAASAAVSPADYLRRTGWVTQSLQRDGDCLTPALQRFSDAFDGDRALKERAGRLNSLRRRVNENIVEGSNPRGELMVLEVARALRVLDRTGAANDRFKVKPEHMRQAFVMANLVRLKPYPGCEDAVRSIVEDAADIFFV